MNDTTFLAFALRGGKNGFMFYVIHALVIGMAAFMAIDPTQFHWVAAVILAAVLVVLWVGTYTQWQAMRLTYYMQENMRLRSPRGWHTDAQDIYGGPFAHGYDETLNMSYASAPWMSTPMWMPGKYLGREVAAIANRAYSEGKKAGA